MGLDSWLLSTRAPLDSDVDFDSTNVGNSEVSYWRKNWDVHDWMSDLYQQKGGTEDDFNCRTVVLEYDDFLRFCNDTNQSKDLFDEGTEVFNRGEKMYFTSWY